jgi:hypothetical protein
MVRALPTTPHAIRNHMTHIHAAILTTVKYPLRRSVTLAPHTHHTQRPRRMPATALPEPQHTQASSGHQGPALLPRAPGIPSHAQRSLLTAHCTASVCARCGRAEEARTCMVGVRGQDMRTRVGPRGPTAVLFVNVESDIIRLFSFQIAPPFCDHASNKRLGVSMSCCCCCCCCLCRVRRLHAWPGLCILPHTPLQLYHTLAHHLPPAQRCRHQHTQAHRHTDTDTHRHTNTPCQIHSLPRGLAMG